MPESETIGFELDNTIGVISSETLTVHDVKEAFSGLKIIVDYVSTNPQLMAFIGPAVGLILATPVGQGILALVAVVAIGYYAVTAIKAKFQGFYKMLRTMDEFTILLDKIQRMIQLTVFISSTYSFDINVDEILKQIEVVFSRLDEPLTDDDRKKIKNDVTDPTKKIDIEGAANAANAASLDMANNETEQAKVQSGGSRKRQHGGGFFANLKSLYSKFTFPVEAWNRNLLDDIVRLNIRLTTSMGEFNIVLNVLQMSMIADSLGSPDAQIKSNAIKALVTKNNTVRDSSEYMKLRAGILINDILALRVDFDYCNKGNMLTKTTGESVCKGYTKKDKTGTTYRGNLHAMIIKLCGQLESGDGYDNTLKKLIIDNIINPYVTLLEKSKFSPTPPADILETLKSFNLEKVTLAQDDKDAMDAKLEVLKSEISQKVSGLTVVQNGGGGFFGFGKKKTPPAATGPKPKTESELIIDYLKEKPNNLISNSSLDAYFKGVHSFSKKIGEQTAEEKAKTAENIEDSVPPPLVEAPTPVPTPAPTPEPAAESASDDTPVQRDVEEVDAMDSNGLWYQAFIVKRDEKEVLVHFSGWSKETAEKIPLSDVAKRIRARSASTATGQLPGGRTSAEVRQMFGVNPAAPVAAPATVAAPAPAPAPSSEGKVGGRSTRKKVRRTKSAQNPKRKSYKYRVKL